MRWIPMTSEASSRAALERIMDHIVARLDRTMTDSDQLVSAFVTAVYSFISKHNVNSC